MFSLVYPYEKIIVLSCYIFNFINKNFVEICFSTYISTSIVSSIFLLVHKAQNIYSLPFIEQVCQSLAQRNVAQNQSFSCHHFSIFGFGFEKNIIPHSKKNWVQSPLPFIEVLGLYPYRKAFSALISNGVLYCNCLQGIVLLISFYNTCDLGKNIHRLSPCSRPTIVCMSN